MDLIQTEEQPFNLGKPVNQASPCRESTKPAWVHIKSLFI
jgi:hypothetical protein